MIFSDQQQYSEQQLLLHAFYNWCTNDYAEFKHMLVAWSDFKLGDGFWHSQPVGSLSIFSISTLMLFTSFFYSR